VSSGGSECANRISSANCLTVLHSNHSNYGSSFQDITTGLTTGGRTDVGNHCISGHEWGAAITVNKRHGIDLPRTMLRPIITTVDCHTSIFTIHSFFTTPPLTG